jgi:ubiquinone/menaquinone biosynthesis C-methylase UbiE
LVELPVRCYLDRGEAVGFYSQVVFPCLCDFLLRQPFLAKYRRELLATVSGDILEIGFGTGLNLPHYPSHVRRITAIDANVGMNSKAKKQIKRCGIEVDQRLLDCERLPFADDAFDCVVSTWTLCSIEDVNHALGEVYRVLKSGGRFLFLEHGLSPEPGVQKWQRRLNWLEMRLAGGCRLDRNIRAIVAAQAFASLQVEEFDIGKPPKTHGYMYCGTAVK